MSENCVNCGGEIDDNANEIARQMIKAMIKDIGANPDLAAKLFIVLKMAAEKN